jgi:SPP1 gp7 family putative phage head morphogenesis protein
MADVNQMLLDLELRHQINLHKYTNGEVKKIIALLNKAQTEIVERIRVLDEGGSSASFTRARLDALLRSIQDITERAHERVRESMSGTLSDLIVQEAELNAKRLSDTIPVNLVLAQPSEAQLRAAIASEPWEGKLLKEWTDEMGDATFSRVRAQIRMGFIQNETIDQIVQRIRGTRALNFRDGVWQASRSTAESFVRTTVASVSNYARQSIFDANADIIKEIRWSSTLDSSTCQVCGALDGKTFPLKTGPRPPKHRGCRCATTPVVKGLKELGLELPEGERASMNGTVPRSTTYAAWIKSQSAEVQDEALGKTRGALLRRGELDVSDFVNNKSDILTLDELKSRHPAAFKKANVEA